MALLDKAKAVCRVTSTAFDDEINDLIEAGFADLGLTDINEGYLEESTAPVLVIRALMTYVSMNFKLNNGQIDNGSYDRLKASYDEQKKQLSMADMYREDE